MENTIGMRIRQLREAKSLSVADFAKAAGVKPSAVYGLESGANRPSLETVAHLRAFFPDLNTEWLQFGEGEMFKGGRVLIPLAAAEPAADYTSAEATTNTLYISILKEQVADLKADKSRLLSENVDLRDEVKMLLGKPFDSPDAADELPVDPNAPTFSGDGAPNPHLRGRRLGFQQQRAAGLS